MINPENNAIDNWQLFKDNGYWYFQVYDEVNKKWSVYGPFEDYKETSSARDGMMSDSYQDSLLGQSK